MQAFKQEKCWVEAQQPQTTQRVLDWEVFIFSADPGVVEEEGKAGDRQGPDLGLLCYPAIVVDLVGVHWNYLPRLVVQQGMGCFPLDLKHTKFQKF